MTDRFLGILIQLVICMSMCLLSGCEVQTGRQESYFELGETAYRAGQYEIAHQNYSAFLKQNPDPQLARLAERRILAIEREIECVLGQKSGPRPAYVNQEEARGAIPSQHPNVVTKPDRSGRLPVYE